ncbi:MAG: 5-methyltetrahydropteroyltriglutamate--homocysteine S-methyltransferase [Pirellulales bacterium]
MSDLFVGLGFELHHVGGISRAWVRTTSDGRTVVVTDPGGYDLPDDAGPFLVFELRDGVESDSEPLLVDDADELRARLRGDREKTLQAMLVSRQSPYSASERTLTVQTANLGFPRLGPQRELKRVLERYWSGKADEDELLAAARDRRLAGWKLQQALGIEQIPSNDDSLYDHVLDTACMVGAVPERYGRPQGPVDLPLYFAMARGVADEHGKRTSALEMTKWFDTNYHYLVPELATDQAFHLASRKPIERFQEALAVGIRTRPVLLGPVTFLLSAKSTAASGRPLELLPKLLPVYVEVLRELIAAGAEWVQIDEPGLVLDLDDAARAAFLTAYESLAREVPQAKLMLTTYFGALGDNLATAAALPTAGLHVDLVRAPEQLDDVLRTVPADRVLSLGVVDGRNIWRADLDYAHGLVRQAHAARRPENLLIAPSCSLLHVPHDLALETGLDDELRSWLAFAVQKLEELKILASADPSESRPTNAPFVASRQAVAGRRVSPRVHRQDVAARLLKVDDAMLSRRSPFATRMDKQRERLNLPWLPTTTIGSFPQTDEVRKARAEHKAGKQTTAEYEEFLRREIAQAVTVQERIGLDVLVHGEPERNDMVEYFGEQLEGFAFTEHGWVQSYGSRCVKPPIVFGDVSRPGPMTVEWSRVCAVADRATDERNAHRARHHPAMVVRPQRRPAQRNLPANCFGAS